MPRDFKNAPSWCPDAIATTRGWVDPVTNELLVSIKGLEGAIDQGVNGKGTTQKAGKVSPKVEVSPVVETEEKSETPEVVAEVETPAEEPEVKPETPAEEPEVVAEVKPAEEPEVVAEVKPAPKKKRGRKKAS